MTLIERAAIEDSLNPPDKTRITISEIKRRIAAFIEKRELNERYNAPRRRFYADNNPRPTFYMRDGIRIERGAK